MKPNVLLLAPPDGVVRSWSQADAPLERWRGAMIEQAFLEIVRTLDGPSRLGDILVPWSALLAPLLAITLPDGRPRFDPEGGADARAPRGRFRPYAEDPLVAERDHDLLAGIVPGGERLDQVPLEALIARYKPRFTVALGWPDDDSALRSLPEGAIFAIGPLMNSSQRIRAEKIGALVLEMDTLLPDGLADVPFIRGLEETLEPFVPYGLLVQRALEEWLDLDDEVDRGPDGRLLS